MTARRNRILLVDDDPLVVRGLSRTLQRSYDVVGLTDAQAALARLADRDESFDVIISDVIMPGIDSQAFYAALERAWPQARTRTIFLTGLVEPEELRQQYPGLTGRLLQKPVETQQLLDVIAALLRPEASA